MKSVITIFFTKIMYFRVAVIAEATLRHFSCALLLFAIAVLLSHVKIAVEEDHVGNNNVPTTCY